MSTVIKGRWYPEMPPQLDGEDIGHYSDRLVGVYGDDQRPYDHPRNRQCSIGWHEECSDPAGERCKCPCHREPAGQATDRSEDSVQQVRADLMQGATHWAEVAAQYDPLKATGPAEAAAGAAAAMAHNYSYVLAALLGQMADMADTGDEDRWTAEEAAEFVYDLLANGDADHLNADVMVPAASESEVGA